MAKIEDILQSEAIGNGVLADGCLCVGGSLFFLSRPSHASFFFSFSFLSSSFDQPR